MSDESRDRRILGSAPYITIACFLALTPLWMIGRDHQLISFGRPFLVLGGVAVAIGVVTFIRDFDWSAELGYSASIVWPLWFGLRFVTGLHGPGVRKHLWVLAAELSLYVGLLCVIWAVVNYDQDFLD